jgi:hypothetical protein
MELGSVTLKINNQHTLRRLLRVRSPIIMEEEEEEEDLFVFNDTIPGHDRKSPGSAMPA